MYNQHFGFQSAPFSLTPDTGQFVSLKGHQECFDLICYSLSTGEGFVKIIGEVGTGKTILCRKLLRFLANPGAGYPEFVSLYIPNPLLSPTGLLRALAQELGIQLTDDSISDVILEQISVQMLELAKDKKSVVIIIDEAQALPEETLEALRLLTNLETETHKLVQVVLFGQTELNDILDKHKFRQLKQRITFQYHLVPLSFSSTEHYLRHRIMNVGFSGEVLFVKRAVQRLFRYSHGIPRLINVLAHKALLSAYARGEYQVTAKDVDRAISDSKHELDGQKSSARGWLVAFSILALVAVIVSSIQIQAGLLQ